MFKGCVVFFHLLKTQNVWCRSYKIFDAVRQNIVCMWWLYLFKKTPSTKFYFFSTKKVVFYQRVAQYFLKVWQYQHSSPVNPISDKCNQCEQWITADLCLLCAIMYETVVLLLQKSCAVWLICNIVLLGPGLTFPNPT